MIFSGCFFNSYIYTVLYKMFNLLNKLHDIMLFLHQFYLSAEINCKNIIHTLNEKEVNINEYVL